MRKSRLRRALTQGSRPPLAGKSKSQPTKKRLLAAQRAALFALLGTELAHSAAQGRSNTGLSAGSPSNAPDARRRRRQKSALAERTTKPVKNRSARVASAVHKPARRHCACGPHSMRLSNPESGGAQVCALVPFPAHPLSRSHVTLRRRGCGRPVQARAARSPPAWVLGAGHRPEERKPSRSVPLAAAPSRARVGGGARPRHGAPCKGQRQQQGRAARGGAGRLQGQEARGCGGGACPRGQRVGERRAARGERAGGAAEGAARVK